MNLLNLKPSNQSKLYNYNNFFFNLVNLYNNQSLPNQLIFSGKKGIGKSTFAYHLINYIFSINEDFKYDLKHLEINSMNKSFNLIQNHSHPNFYLIDLADEKKNIEISQIRNMYNFANKSAFNNKERIILIDNAENLSLSSSSALLKIIEEPNNNVFFILIYDNSKNILETIKSRCLKFNFYLSFDKCINTANNIINDDIYNNINKELINHYNTVGDIINLLNLSQSLNFNLSNISLKSFLIDIIEKKYYKNNFYIKNYVFRYIDLYFLNLMNCSKSKKKISFFYENFAKKFFYLKKFNLDEESFFLDFKTKILNE